MTNSGLRADVSGGGEGKCDELKWECDEFWPDEVSGVRSQVSGGGDTSYLQGRSYYPYGGRDKKARNIIGEFICKGR